VVWLLFCCVMSDRSRALPLPSDVTVSSVIISNMWSMLKRQVRILGTALNWASSQGLSLGFATVLVCLCVSHHTASPPKLLRTNTNGAQ